MTHDNSAPHPAGGLFCRIGLRLFGCAGLSPSICVEGNDPTRIIAHEIGHNLGLPDHYDTAGGPDNAVNWWTLMAQSRVSARSSQ